MGIIRMGPPSDLIKELKDIFLVSTFVETGTFRGGTSYWASEYFKTVYTIEDSKFIHEETSTKFSHVKNINFIHGSSIIKLKDVLKNIDSSPIIWLDAHYSGCETAGKNIENPILKEIDIINSSKPESFIFIDDARIFLSPWVDLDMIDYTPDISTVLIKLNEIPDRFIVIIEDIIISVPIKAKKIIKDYCIQISQKEWTEYGERMLKREVLSGDNNKTNRWSWKSAFSVCLCKKFSNKK